ncbi:N-acetylmuramoyl-L-alanine amidase [Deinococcus antarcticus]|uniref:N-acetylmuramoyl-L-alanine amidase n=1 Tax=Deinococcus antarcticus TaxID=1298767 RepID=A0ABV8A9S4_9DEIO
MPRFSSAPPRPGAITSLLLTAALALGAAQAAAQTGPVQGAPPLPVKPTPQLGAAAPDAGRPASAGQPADTRPAPAFGSPRFSSEGGATRVVFDLPPGVTYRLTPTADGLRIDVSGAPVLPAVRPALGPSVTAYRSSNTQVWLATPFALARTEGWRASEATLARGTRVLILDFGPALSGGAGDSLRGLRADAVAAPSPGGVGRPGSPAVNAAPRPVSSSAPLDAGLTPSDVISSAAGVTPPPTPPALPGQTPGQPSALSGEVPGRLQTGTPLPTPRISTNPGLTRVVLDLPPGARYRMVPSGLGLRVELTGVSAEARAAQNVSPEVRAWRYDPTPEGVTVTLLTGTPVTARSGWRAQLVAPLAGSDRSRLAIDLSPALADLTPLTARERVVAAVPALPASGGAAILALSTQWVKPRVVIDAGHGGRDPGGVGAVVEKQVALDVSLRVRDLLRPAGVEVVMTRETDRELLPDKAADLQARAALGTPGTQLFLSIHVNAMPAASALRGYGVETWWNPNHPLSSAFAALLQTNVIAVTGAFSQGLKNNRSLAVLRNSRIPAALIEIGYTSHPVDGLNLQNPNYLDRVALGIAQGVREALVTGVSASGVGEAGK